MSDHLLFEATEELKERQELVYNRIIEISDEQELEEEYQKFFKEICNFLITINGVLEHQKKDKLKDWTLEKHQKTQHQLYDRLLKENYETSYLNPTVAIGELGEEVGGLCSCLYADMLALIPYAFEGREDLVVIFEELFVQVYGCFVSEKGYPQHTKNEVNEAIYWFYHDYSEIFAAESVITMLNPEYDFFTNIVMNSDLLDLRYLYHYGLPIGENEIGLANYVNSLPEEDIQKIADTYTEGYRIGFELTGKDITKKKTVKIEYPIGFERVVRAAIYNFEKLNLKPTIAREAILSFEGRGRSKRGCYSTAINKQFDYDHKDDRAFYFDKAFVERRLEVLKDTFEKNKKLAAEHGGPAVIEVFGEVPFAPINKKERKKYNERQNELHVYFMGEAGTITNEYIKGEERSFTIIAFPIPAIGEKFEEIFSKTVELNTLDYMLYRDMQQKIIDVLDKGTKVYISGKGANHTDLTVALFPLKDSSKETIFENCVADVNIPVGEVFTSPVLKGTNGVLHVTGVFLNELYYKDLELTFVDGMITKYTCKNFENEEDNLKYLKENVLFHHDTLPMGEFAIGTNTTAYRMGKDYNIADKLPILIAEKTGPHFAVGDTCYSYAEDNAVYNPDGKEIVARDNEVSLLRREDASKAYFHCHTDITIPYDELNNITVIDADGNEYDVICDGKFVVEGTEELNIPLND